MVGISVARMFCRKKDTITREHQNGSPQSRVFDHFSIEILGRNGRIRMGIPLPPAVRNVGFTVSIVALNGLSCCLEAHFRRAGRQLGTRWRIVRFDHYIRIVE